MKLHYSADSPLAGQILLPPHRPWTRSISTTAKSSRCNVYFNSTSGGESAGRLLGCARGRNTLISLFVLLSRAPGETFKTNQVPPAALKAWHIRSGQGQPDGRVGSATSFPPRAAQSRQERWLIGIVASSPNPRRVVGGEHGRRLCHRPDRRGLSLGGFRLCRWRPKPGQIFPDKLVCLNPRLGLDVGFFLIFMESRRVRLPETGRTSGASGDL